MIDDDAPYANNLVPRVYNKLTLAEKLEYVCGPPGIKVHREYIILIDEFGWYGC